MLGGDSLHVVHTCLNVHVPGCAHRPMFHKEHIRKLAARGSQALGRWLPHG